MTEELTHLKAKVKFLSYPVPLFCFLNEQVLVQFFSHTHSKPGLLTKQNVEISVAQWTFNGILKRLK